MAHPSKRGGGFEPEVVKVLQGYAIEAVKDPAVGTRRQAAPATSAQC